MFFFLGFNKLTDHLLMKPHHVCKPSHFELDITEYNLISDLSVANGQGASLTFGCQCP